MAQIKKDTSLRKAILQAAITGQLISDIGGESLPLAAAGKPSSATPSAGTPRNAPTETGKELLDRIIEERNNKLLAEWEEKQTDLFASNDAHSKNAKTVRSEQIRLSKKIKKPEPIVASEIDEDEIPFEIPENWCWCRFGEITINRDSERIPLSVSQRELLKKKYDYYGASGIIDKVDNYLFDKDLLLIGEDGANLLTRSTPIAFIASGKYWVNNHAHVIDCNSNYINLNYIKFFINAISLAKYVTGTAQPKMNQEKMNSIPVALPPLAVQNAIVAKLEQVLPLVDAYENALLQKEELKSALPDKIKKAILQEAITGQLTENWRKSATIKESGKQLLDRIIEERNAKALADWEEALKKNPKAKKPVPVVASEIGEDEIPFEIPESWCWCHLGEICNEIKRGKSPKYVDRSDYLAFAQKCNVKTGGIDLSLALYLDEKSIDRYSEEDNLIQGDVVINSTGGGTMGRVGYYETKVPEGIKGVYPDSHVTVIRSVGNINQRYLYYILKHNQPVLEDCGTGSTNQTELKPAVLANFVIPLPPLEEQEEIVRKVEELLPLCK